MKQCPGYGIQILSGLFALVSMGCAAGDTPEGLYAEVTTSKGLIVIQLAYEQTPMTVANFVGLAEGTLENDAFDLGRPFFDGTPWHRVVPGHVIQCGAPANSQAEGPGYEFPNEICLPELNHNRAGMVNMANAGPHTNGSQWCIMLGDRSYLNGDYTVFGRVIQGLDVVFKITQDDKIETVKIIRIGSAAQSFHPTTATFTAMVQAAKAQAKAAEAEKRWAEQCMIKTRWPDAQEGNRGEKIQICQPGTGACPQDGDTVKVVYTGSTLYGKEFVSTNTGEPYWGGTPEPFLFEVGESHLCTGFDAAITDMKKGERRMIILPSALAYGLNGFYAKERPGDKRFVISPNTTLVYTIELIHE